MDKGLIVVIIGGLLSCTIYGVLIGAPLTLIGAYLIYKDYKKSDSLSTSINEKEEQLNNLNDSISQKAKEANEFETYVFYRNIRNTRLR